MLVLIKDLIHSIKYLKYIEKYVYLSIYGFHKRMKVDLTTLLLGKINL